MTFIAKNKKFHSTRALSRMANDVRDYKKRTSKSRTSTKANWLHCGHLCFQVWHTTRQRRGWRIPWKLRQAHHCATSCAQKGELSLAGVQILGAESANDVDIHWRDTPCHKFPAQRLSTSVFCCGRLSGAESVPHVNRGCSKKS